MAKITPNSPRVWLIWLNNGSLGKEKEKTKGERRVRSGVHACGSERMGGGGRRVEMGAI